MSIIVSFNCDGCHRAEPGKRALRRHFDSINGKGYGFGYYRFDGVEDVVPNDWISFDPYTGFCYCPECWAQIEAPEDNAEQSCNTAAHT